MVVFHRLHRNLQRETARSRMAKTRARGFFIVFLVLSKYVVKGLDTLLLLLLFAVPVRLHVGDDQKRDDADKHNGGKGVDLWLMPTRAME